MPTILVGDTNIWIDLKAGGLLKAAFSLPFTYVVPDLLYEDELKEYEGPDLLHLGLKVEALSEDEITVAEDLATRHPRPGRMDIIALSLALARGWDLLSGDSGLREAAQREGCRVHGTLWILRELVKAGILSRKQAEERIEVMRGAGRRLPRLEW